MKLIIVCGLIAAAVADRLENTYLPPNNARTAGGNGNFLSAPFGGGKSGFGSPSNNYLPPTSGSRFGQGSSGSSSFGHKSSGSFGSSKTSGSFGSSFGHKSAGSFGGSFGSKAGSSSFGGSSSRFGQAPSSQYGAPSGSGSFGSRGSSGSFGSSGSGSFGSSGSGSFGSRGSSGSFGSRGSSGSFGSSGSGSFGSGSSGSFGSHAFSQKSSGSSHFGQAPSSQYGAPSTSYGVPSGSSARFGGGQSRDGGAAIVRSNNDNFGDGTYRYEYETDNKISHQEAGEQKNVGGEQATAVHGSYSYTGDDGQEYTVNYIADENGFQPIGAHLPTPPPVPEAIQRSIAQNAQQGYSGSQHGGFQSSSGSGGSQATNRQYLAPNKPSFNSQSGYQY